MAGERDEKISSVVVVMVFCALLSYGCNPKQTALSDKGGIWAVYDRGMQEVP